MHFCALEAMATAALLLPRGAHAVVASPLARDGKQRSFVELREAVASLKLGGVGFYSNSNFVHVDVGRIRHWSGS